MLGGRACEGRVVDNLRNAQRVIGVRRAVLVEIVREVVESLPLLEVEAVALLSGMSNQFLISNLFLTLE
jgi:hypothetical protein